MLSAYLEWYEDESIIVAVELIFENQIWVLKELSDIIFSMWIDVDSINTTNMWKRKTKIELKLKVLDYDYLIIDRFIERLKLNFKTKLFSSIIGKIIKDKN
jgi:(p)ppGpp synthase/HD superfamily hydrolase